MNDLVHKDFFVKYDLCLNFYLFGEKNKIILTSFISNLFRDNYKVKSLNQLCLP